MSVSGKGLKLAVAGKGGVGKTLIASTLARLLARDGYRVLAVDADPNVNLATALGIPPDVADRIVPISENEQLVRERTGVGPEEPYSGVFNMTPSVGDIVEKFGVVGPDGVSLLVMGTVKAGNSGCMCGANALLRVLVQHLLIQRGEVVVMDMEAGLEHLGRGTARRMDVMVVVMEPRIKSIDTARRVLKLAREIEVGSVIAVGNKVSSKEERHFIEERVGELGIPVVAYVPLDEKVAEADMRGVPILDYDSATPAAEAIRSLKEFLKREYVP